MKKPLIIDNYKCPCRQCNGTGEGTDHARLGLAARELRNTARVHLREQARRLKLSASFVSDLERGRRNWTEQMVEKYISAVMKGPSHG